MSDPFNLAASLLKLGSSSIVNPLFERSENRRFIMVANCDDEWKTVLFYVVRVKLCKMTSLFTG